LKKKYGKNEFSKFSSFNAAFHYSLYAMPVFIECKISALPS